MADQPEALRLADRLESDFIRSQTELDAAAELRRLHEAHEWQYKMAGDRLRRIEKLEALNAELLEVLISFTKSAYIKKQHPKRYAAAIAAIAKAEGQK
jgi:hypothetical protein